MSDLRRRELERRAALGDAEAAAQLQAMLYRAPVTEQQATEAMDPVQQAWTAWQQGYGTREQYEHARYAVEGVGDGTHTPFTLGQIPRDTWGGNVGGGWIRRSEPVLVLDHPQADAVLQAYQQATGKPWDTALSYSGWGKGRKPTVAQATQIVVAYYRSLGYSPDPNMPGTTSGRQIASRPLVSADGLRRVVFSRNTLRREARQPLPEIGPAARGHWYRDYSRDPTDQVGIVALAEALVRRAIRARDWRTNPPRKAKSSYAGPLRSSVTFYYDESHAPQVTPVVLALGGRTGRFGSSLDADWSFEGPDSCREAKDVVSRLRASPAVADLLSRGRGMITGTSPSRDLCRSRGCTVHGSRRNPGEDERQRRLARQAASGDAEAAARLRAAQARSGTGPMVRLGDLVFGPRMLGRYPEQSRSVRGWSPYGTTPFAIGRQRVEEVLHEVLDPDLLNGSGVFSVADGMISYEGMDHEIEELGEHLTNLGADDGGWAVVNSDYGVGTMWIHNTRVPSHVADRIEAEWLRHWPPCPATSRDRNLACDRVVGHPGPHEYA